MTVHSFYYVANQQLAFQCRVLNMSTFSDELAKGKNLNVYTLILSLTLGAHARGLQYLLTLGVHARGLQYLLTLGAHARGLQYLFCLCVCFPYSGTSRNQAYKQQYQRLQRDTGMKYKMGFFFKTLRSEVMASFTHLK